VNHDNHATLPPADAIGGGCRGIDRRPTHGTGRCTYLSANSTMCQTPGNVQINDSPAPVQYAPQFPYFGGNLIILHHHHGLSGHR